MHSRTVRIGAVSYLNTLPLVEGMEQGLGAERVRLSYSVPSALAERMARGELDVALLPVIELARIPDLEVVPGLGIVTRGACRSVLLVSNRPVTEVRTVALDPESRTSNALVQVLFCEVWDGRPAFREGPRSLRDALETHDAAVRIGDKALFEPIPGGAHVYDLGTTWTDATGLPFVFAAWAARPGVVDPELFEILRDSLCFGLERLDRIARDFRFQGRTDAELVRRYLTEHIHFRFGPEEQRGMERFLLSVARLGLIDGPVEIRLSEVEHAERNAG